LRWRALPVSLRTMASACCRATAFLALARAAGIAAHDGLGMLVEQAAESFYLWRGVRPDTAAVLAALRAH